MVVVNLNIPDEYYNKMNNYFLTNFGYNIHTHLYAVVLNEVEKCEDYPATEPEVKPKPSIRNNPNNPEQFTLYVTYPDNSKQQVNGEFNFISQVLIEWSKYSFEKDKREKVLTKFDKTKYEYITQNNGLWDVRRNFDGKNYHFGLYENLNDALLVRNFLIKKDWDLKYMGDKHKLLDIAKGEMEHEIN